MDKIPNLFRKSSNSVQSTGTPQKKEFAGRSVTVANKTSGLSAAALPEAEPTKLNRFEKLDRALFKLLSKIFNPKLTLQFPSLLKKEVTEVKYREDYEQSVNELLSLKKGSKRSLALDLSQVKSKLDRGQLIYLLAHDPRTQGFFTKGLGKELKETARSKGDVETVQKALANLVYNTQHQERESLDQDWVDLEGSTQTTTNLSSQPSRTSNHPEHYPDAWFAKNIQANQLPESYQNFLQGVPEKSPERTLYSEIAIAGFTPWRDNNNYRIYPQVDQEGNKTLTVYSPGGEKVENFTIDENGQVKSE